MKRPRHKLRNRDNFAADIVVLLDAEHVEDPQRLAQTLDAVRANGFRSALVGLRTTQFEITDAKVLAAFRHLVELGAQRGLAIWLQVDLQHARREFLRQFPKCRQHQMAWVVAQTADGEVSRSLLGSQSGDVLATGQPRLVRAYALSAGKASDVTRQVELRPSADGWTAQWEPQSVAADEIAVFAAVELDTFDYARLETVRFARELMVTMTREVGNAAGFWTDEPGHAVPGDWRSLFVSDAFFHEFKERHRYDLRERLASLAWDLPTSGSTRQAAVSTWADMVFRVHSMLRTQAAHHSGREANVGVCSGRWGVCAAEGLRGNADWFRFAAATQTGGFTGGAPLDEEATDWGVALARSLGKYHPDRLASHASWDTDLAGERARPHANLLCAQSVRSILAEAGQSDLELTLAEQRCLATSNRRLAWTGERTGFESPRANVAVVYNWRAAARLWGEAAEAYLRSLRRLAGTLTKQGIAFDILSPDHLTTADDMTETGGFTRAEETYDALVYPWPVAHAPLDWEILLTYLEEGGKAVLYGLPPELAGADAVGEAFGEFLGCSVPAASRFSPSRQPLEFRGQTVPVVDAGLLAVLDAAGDPRVATTAGATLGVRSQGANCWYLSYDAGLMTPTLIPQLLDDLGVPRLFRASVGVRASRIGDLIVCAAEPGRSLLGVGIRVEGKSFAIQEPADLAILDLNTGAVEAFTE